MTTSVTRSRFTKQHQNCKTKTDTKTDFFGLRPVLSYDRRSQTTSLLKCANNGLAVGGLSPRSQLSCITLIYYYCCRSMFSSILSRHLVNIDIAPRWCNVYSWPTVLPCRSLAFSSRPGRNLLKDWRSQPTQL